MNIKRIQFLFFALVIIAIVAAFVLAGLYPMLSHAPAPSASLLRTRYLEWLQPEPRERFVFVTLGVALPIMALLVALSPMRDAVDKLMLRAHRGADALPLLVSALLTYPLFGSDFLATIAGRYGEAGTTSSILLFVALCSAALWCALIVRRLRRRIGDRLRRAIDIAVWTVFAAGIILQIFSWRVRTMTSVSSTGVETTDLDATIYAFSQVAGGKTLLVDLPSQYGLAPEILAPLFRLTGHGLLGLTLLFALLQALSMIALFASMSMAVRNRALLLVAGFALLTGTFGMWWYFIHIPDPYFQYWPIRSFWPAISVFFFARFANKRSLARSAVVSAIGAVALLWNLDTGLFVVIAHAAYLCVRPLIGLAQRQDAGARPCDSWSRTTYVRALLLHIVIVAALVSAFLIVLGWNARAPLHVDWLIKYQRIFYGVGFAMLPLPLAPHPWMSILGIYLLALLSSFMAWHDSPATSRRDLIFYVAVLGLGLFIYYQGRSHIFVLMCVLWPALLIAVIEADHMLRAIRGRLLPLSQACLPVATIGIVLFSATSFLLRTPRLLVDVARQVKTRDQIADPVVQDELAFIKTRAKPGEACLILAQRQGLYYAEAGLVSPVTGPGLVETILKEDEVHLTKALLNGQLHCVFLGVGAHSESNLSFPGASVHAVYAVKAENAAHSMLYLVPK